MLKTLYAPAKHPFLGNLSRNFFEFSGNEPWHILLGSGYVRKKLINYVEENLYSKLLGNHNYPIKVQEDKYYLARNLIRAMDRVFETSAPAVKKTIVNITAQHVFYREPKAAKFRREFGRNPPSFLTISPGKFCNLHCAGCYASSSSACAERLDWDILDRLVKEKTELWGSYLTVISGGEPLLYRDRGRGILDLAEKHRDNFFLMYTNGTLLNRTIAKRLAGLGNVTPAISVEGFEAETDARRGPGVHKRILEAMDNLRAHGVPFGISITATRKNADLVVSDKFIDYYFNKLGAAYGWIFQLMPIGRADSLDLMVTPEQRLRMYRRTQELVREQGIFITDFWNSGCATNGCISAGRQEGYLYVEWNGNVTPCVFNPYSPVNIYDVYTRGGNLNSVLREPFFAAIRKWQDDYAIKRKPQEMGNWITPCAIKDHYGMMKKLLEIHRPKPIDESAKVALESQEYQTRLEAHGRELEATFNPVWEKEYLGK